MVAVSVVVCFKTVLYYLYLLLVLLWGCDLRFVALWLGCCIGVLLASSFVGGFAATFAGWCLALA